ncbi:hypothetical protein PPERSA_05999 [Pseudocohnilembus persalinus]|uniref:Uncharacterized protein n=1 Tax=Pseudocohnilembus persalinus TaxID=266149 RepID=A0A0V0Q7T0_PSEPJ|nr:hypothetical protein PPERSA_05999 [Pseudocohnilembus persalinus]|eukprot:KRW98103.1 hypothetical protein PPERSA_05999 [Pseudocohnilembus persalinus]
MKFQEIQETFTNKYMDLDCSSSKDEIKDASKRKYNRISIEKRDLLLEMIFFDNKKIKNAAKELGINYSSAKTILHLYRKKIKKQGKSCSLLGENKRCSVKQIFDAKQVGSKSRLCNRGNQFSIIFSQGGREMNQAVFNTNPFLQFGEQNEQQTQFRLLNQQQKQGLTIKKDTLECRYTSKKEDSLNTPVVVPKIEDFNSFCQMSNSCDQSTENTMALQSQSKIQKICASNQSSSISIQSSVNYFSKSNNNQNIIQEQQLQQQNCGGQLLSLSMNLNNDLKYINTSQSQQMMIGKYVC